MSDGEILPGKDWGKEIINALKQADLILLIITANFISSDYIWGLELKYALERHNSGDSIVIPIFCKQCVYSHLPFAKIQGLPKNSIPIMNSANVDESLTEVVDGIKSVLETMLK